LDTKRLLSSTALYGIADIAVMAVGGFLLLPLYTRTLSQSEFGMFVAIRANIDILTYVLQFGLPSAIARVYFDHKRLGQHKAYLSSILCFSLVVFAAVGSVLAIWGAPLWALLSPTTPAHPYLAFSVAIAAIGFPAAIASLWLRMEGRAIAMVSLQLGASLVLAVLAVVNLAVLGNGLPGLLFSLLASAAFSAAALPWLFGRGFRPTIERAHITESLRYAVPILVGYIAYFVLNRLSTLILQHHVGVDQLAVFGVAQQLSMIVTIACTSFGMALQPMVFGAEPSHAMEAIRRASRILTLLMFGVTSALILFGAELFALIAPKGYGDGYPILLVLLVSNFSNAFTLVSDTTLLYHRRPRTSVAVSIVSAIAAACLGLWLIPEYHLNGAALSVAGGFMVRMIISHWMAYRVAGTAFVGPMLGTVAALCLLASATGWLQQQALQLTAAVSLKALLGAAILLSTTLIYRKSRSQPCAS